MKTIALVLALFTFFFCTSQAQDLPNDLTAISQADAPPFATYYSIAYWPDFPPLPWNAWDSAADLYYSPTYGTCYIWVDDRAKVAGRMLTESFDPPPIPGGDGGGPDYFPPQPSYDWTTNYTDLWIWLDSYTNAGDGMTYFFTIHNTQSGLPYEIISSTNVAAPMNPTNWYSEGSGWPPPRIFRPTFPWAARQTEISSVLICGPISSMECRQMGKSSFNR